MPIPDALRRIYASAPTSEYFIETLELKHPGFVTGYRFLTNQLSGWTGRVPGRYPTDIVPGTSRLQEFVYYPFAVLPPRAEDQADITLNVTLGNASRELMDDLERLAESPQVPLEVIYRVYIDSDPDTVQNEPGLYLEAVEVTALQNTVSFKATLPNLRGAGFPRMLYTVALYPGLAR